MMYEYLASVQSAVRRVNDRIATLSARFGENSAIVNNIKAEVDVLLSDNYRYKEGVIQITRPSDIYGNEEKEKAISHLDDSIKTWGHYKKEYEKEYESYRAEEREKVTYKGHGKRTLSQEDFIQTMANLDKALKEVPSDAMPQDALTIMKEKGKRKTYSQLFKVYTILQQKGFI